MTRKNVSDQDVGLALDPELRALPNPPLAATYDEERRTDAIRSSYRPSTSCS